MKERLMEQFLLLIEQGKNVNLMELELAKQYLNWAFCINIIGFLSGVIFIIACIYLITRARGMDNAYGDAVPFYCVGVVSGAFGITITIFTVIEGIKIILYPKIFLLTSLLSIVK